jgi:nucleoside-diphosphate-sugar epimerase
MRILVLGGTSFVGRAIVEDALRTGAEMTLFGRGKTQVEIVPVSPDKAPPLFPLVKPNRPTQQRSPVRARAAGLPATPLEVTAADVLAWDRRRGEPPLACGFSPEQEQALLAQQDNRALSN